jgi:hypothetical protein
VQALADAVHQIRAARRRTCPAPACSSESMQLEPSPGWRAAEVLLSMDHGA